MEQNPCLEYESQTVNHTGHSYFLYHFKPGFLTAYQARSISFCLFFANDSTKTSDLQNHGFGLYSTQTIDQIIHSIPLLLPSPFIGIISI
jgi:hypothetical protein